MSKFFHRPLKLKLTLSSTIWLFQKVQKLESRDHILQFFLKFRHILSAKYTKIKIFKKIDN